MPHLAANAAEPRSQDDIESQGNVDVAAVPALAAEKDADADEPSSSSSSLNQDRKEPSATASTTASRSPLLRKLDYVGERLARYNVEAVSVAPVPRALRTEKKWWSVGLLWFSANFNVLSFSTGTLVSELELSATGAFCTIVFFCLFSSLFPAFFVTFGPRLGMRQMIHTRFSWGW